MVVGRGGKYVSFHWPPDYTYTLIPVGGVAGGKLKSWKSAAAKSLSPKRDKDGGDGGGGGGGKGGKRGPR